MKPATVTSFAVAASYDGSCTTVSTAHRVTPPAGAASTKAAQLHALLHLSYGEGFQAFSNSDATIQEALHWLAADLANEVRVLSDLALEADR